MRLLTKILLVPLLTFAATFAFAQSNNTPFQHVIIVVQENRTPDNLFGYDLHEPNGQRRLPNAHLVSSGLCESGCGCYNNQNHQQALQALPLATCADPDHSHAQSQYFPGAWELMYNSGNMNGACMIPDDLLSTCTPVPSCYSSTQGQDTCMYSYVDNTPGGNGSGIVEPYFQIATNYGYANWMFQTSQGPSFEAHQFLFTGTSAPIGSGGTGDNCNSGGPCYHKWFASELLYGDQNTKDYGCVAPAGAVALEENTSSNESPGFTPPWFPWTYDAGYPCYDHNTMSDLLEANGLSWRFYSDNNANGQWSCAGQDWTNGKIALNSSQILTDLGADSSTCNLQPVSWVIPDGTWSDHPGGGPGTDAGPSWVAAITNAVGGYWYDSNMQQHQTACWQRRSDVLAQHRHPGHLGRLGRLVR